MFDMPILAIFQLVPFLLWTLLTMTLSMAAQQLLRKKPKKPKSLEPGAFEVPTIKEGDAFGVVFGTPKLIENPIVAWWGDVKTIAIRDSYRKPSGWFNTKREWYTTGYRYLIGMQLIPSIGPVDGLKQVRVGEKVAWPVLDDFETFASDGITSISLNLPSFFGVTGGDLIGDIDIQYGEADQEPNDYLVAGLGSDITASRGLVSIILQQVEIGQSPYPKQWNVILKRTQILTDGTAQWYISKADIGGDLNPAHFLRECYTNVAWGLGYATSLFPAATWEAVADVLYDEDFGVSRFWRHSQETLEDVIVDILETIDAVIYQDPQTGNLILKLIREDYVAASLPVYDASDILELSDFKRPSIGELPNTFYLKFSDVINNVPASIPDHDIALKNQQGGNSITINFEYLSITNPDLANRILARERQQSTSMGASMRLTCKRTMADLLPGDVFKLTWPQLNITEMIIRVLPDAKYGTLDNPQIKLLAIEDIFAAGNPIYADMSQSRAWSLPYNDPIAASSFTMEAPFWTVAKRNTTSLTLLLGQDSGFLIAAGLQPTDGAIDFELLVRNNTSLEFNSEGARDWTPSAVATEAFPLNADDITVTLDTSVVGVASGSYAVIEDEILKVLTSIDSGGNAVITFTRGVLDTVPAAHIASSRIWFIDTYAFLDTDELQAGVIPGIKVLTRNPRGRLAAGDAPVDNADSFDSRLDRPYPPGNFKINSVSYPSSFSGQPTITWSHRDRRIQNDYIVEHSEGDIGPEAEVTYTLIIYDEDNVHLRTIPGITGTTYTYLEADERTDSGFGGGDPLNTSLRFVLYSLRTEV